MKPETALPMTAGGGSYSPLCEALVVRAACGGLDGDAEAASKSGSSRSLSNRSDAVAAAGLLDGVDDLDGVASHWSGREKIDLTVEKREPSDPERARERASEPDELLLTMPGRVDGACLVGETRAKSSPFSATPLGPAGWAEPLEDGPA